MCKEPAGKKTEGHKKNKKKKKPESEQAPTFFGQGGKQGGGVLSRYQLTFESGKGKQIHKREQEDGVTSWGKKTVEKRTAS